MRLKPKTLSAAISFGAAAAVAVLLVAASSASNVVAPPARAASPFVEPSSVSPACRRDASRRAACWVISTFFRAVNSGEYATACSLLGERLRTDTHGMTCPRFMAAGAPEPVPWGILEARLSPPQVVIRVLLGQRELDHVRLRHHLAYVGLEGGKRKILETRLVW